MSKYTQDQRQKAVQDINAKFDEVSRRIREAELQLRSIGHFFTANTDNLKWDGDRIRTLSGIPFIDTKIDVRVAHVTEMDTLVDFVIAGVSRLVSQENVS